MKQGKLIRRAVSAALAGCMMFTLSAPALAASTDDLLQQSTAAKSAVNVLDEENGMTEETAYQMDLNNGNQVAIRSCKILAFMLTISLSPARIIKT